MNFADLIMIMSAVAALPEDKQENALLTVLSAIAGTMASDEIRLIVSDIERDFPEHDRPPVVTHTLDMIEGQLALRALNRS